MDTMREDHHTSTVEAAAAFEAGRGDHERDAPERDDDPARLLEPCTCGRWCRVDVPCTREPAVIPCDACGRQWYVDLLDTHGLCGHCAPKAANDAAH
jgi:hypothetical protein